MQLKQIYPPELSRGCEFCYGKRREPRPMQRMYAHKLQFERKMRKEKKALNRLTFMYVKKTAMLGFMLRQGIFLYFLYFFFIFCFLFCFYTIFLVHFLFTFHFIFFCIPFIISLLFVFYFIIILLLLFPFILFFVFHYIYLFILYYFHIFYLHQMTQLEGKL